ncbi:MAG: hypothetical protein ABL958_00330 [Bdellovibrionia bacterium]
MKLHYAYVLIIIAAAMTACGPNEFAFEQNSNGQCAEGCFDPETGLLHYDYFETVSGDRLVDILVVDDNSGSMAEEQANMGTRFPTFIAGLAGLQWRLGITTTDVSNGGARGHLIPFTGTNLKYIDAATPNADNLFKSTVQIGVGGSGDERGVYAATLAVELNEGAWIRANSHLAVIVLSDEDEFSDGTGLETKDRPDNFVKTVKDELGTGRTVSVHSIITRPGDTVCLNGDGASYGTVYAELTKLTGGILGDICATDYGAQLQNIAGSIASNVDSFGLKCEPVSGVVAELSPAPATANNYTVNAGRVYFERTLDPGTQVRLVYDCKAPKGTVAAR